MRVHIRFMRTCNILRVCGVIVRMPYLPSRRKVRSPNLIWTALNVQVCVDCLSNFLKTKVNCKVSLKMQIWSWCLCAKSCRTWDPLNENFMPHHASSFHFLAINQLLWLAETLTVITGRLANQIRFEFSSILGSAPVKISTGPNWSTPQISEQNFYSTNRIFFFSSVRSPRTAFMHGNMTSWCAGRQWCYPEIANFAALKSANWM